MRAWIPAACALLFLGAASPAALGQAYIGKVCFTSTVTERETGPVSPAETAQFQYEATNLGGGQFAVSGRAPTSDQPFVASGHGIVIGSELYLTMVTTQTHSDGWRDTGINQTRLNTATMSGSFYEIGTDFHPPTRRFDTRYTAGTVAISTCP